MVKSQHGWVFHLKICLKFNDWVATCPARRLAAPFSKSEALCQECSGIKLLWISIFNCGTTIVDLGQVRIKFSLSHTRGYVFMRLDHFTPWFDLPAQQDSNHPSLIAATLYPPCCSKKAQNTGSEIFKLFSLFFRFNNSINRLIESSARRIRIREMFIMRMTVANFDKLIDDGVIRPAQNIFKRRSRICSSPGRGHIDPT